MALRGIRGAVVANANRPEDILQATQQLLAGILAANPTLQPEDLASAVFTVTDDIHSEFPAKAARQMGWHWVPLMCTREIPVPGGLAQCIRVLLHWNTDLPQNAVQHVYLGEAASLRPDWIVQH